MAEGGDVCKGQHLRSQSPLSTLPPQAVGKAPDSGYPSFPHSLSLQGEYAYASSLRSSGCHLINTFNVYRVPQSMPSAFSHSRYSI